MMVLEFLDLFLKIFVVLFIVDVVLLGTIEIIKAINKHRRKRKK